MPKIVPAFKVRRYVDMAETDMAGIVHFSSFFNYMESAEAAFFRSLGFHMVNKEGDALTGWPRVRAQCSYVSPLRFEDLFEVSLAIEALKLKAICYQFRFHRVDKTSNEPEELIAKGSMTTLFAKFTKSGHMTSAEPPAALWAVLERFVQLDGVGSDPARVVLDAPVLPEFKL